MNPVILRPGNGEHIAAGASTAVMKATAETSTPARAQIHNGQLLRSRRNLAYDGRR